MSSDKILALSEKDELLPKWSASPCCGKAADADIPGKAKVYLIIHLQANSANPFKLCYSSLVALLLHGQLLLGVNHKMIQGMSNWLNLYSKPCRKRGNTNRPWRSEDRVDVEADEATFDKTDVTQDIKCKKGIKRGK